MAELILTLVLQVVLLPTPESAPKTNPGTARLTAARIAVIAVTALALGANILQAVGLLQLPHVIGFGFMIPRLVPLEINVFPEKRV